MRRFEVRRLAAVDLYGTVGSRIRRRIIVAEFIVGVVGCLALGIVVLVVGGPVGRYVGLWLCGVGINYVPLALHALDLVRPGALDRELSGVDVRAELNYYGVAQLLIAVPLLIAGVALVQLGRRRQPTGPIN
jgi:hypothetical protein